MKVFFCTKRNLLFFFKVTPLSLLQTKKLFFRINKKIIFFINNQIVLTDMLSRVKKLKNNRYLIFYNFFFLNEQFQFIFKSKKLKIKLSLIGIGFKFFIHSNPCLLEIKVGYSHNIFFKLPKQVKKLGFQIRIKKKEFFILMKLLK